MKKFVATLLLIGLITPVSISGILNNAKTIGVKSAPETSHKVMQSINFNYNYKVK